MANYGQGGTGQTDKPLGTTIKESIPGTREHQAAQGVTDAHRRVEQLKAHIPGTEEHRIHEATTGTGGTTMGMGGMGTEQQHKPLGQKVKEAIPGTREHDAKKAAEGRF